MKKLSLFEKGKRKAEQSAPMDPAELAKLQAEFHARKAQLTSNMQAMASQLRQLEKSLDGMALEAKMRDVYLPAMFPHQMTVNELVEKLDNFTVDQMHIQDRYTPEYLLFHLRDHAWLAKYADAVIKQCDPQATVDLYQIQEFIVSEDFDTCRREFEQRVIQGYIRHEMRSKMTESEFAPVKKLHEAYHGEYDTYLRNAVTTSVRLLGIDQHTAEIGLETNADMWRKQTMIYTFENHFYPDERCPMNSGEREEWNNLKAKHQEVWLQQREYEYYQKYQPSVDEAKSHTDSMFMTLPQAQQLNDIVAGYEQMRTVMLRQFDQNRLNRRQAAAQLETHTL